MHEMDDHNTKKASERFFAIPELLSIVAGYIDSPAELKRLCFVNKAFDNAFSAMVFGAIHLNLSVSLTRRVGQLLSTPKLNKTRFVGCYQAQDLDNEANAELSSYARDDLERLLQNTPALRTFQCLPRARLDILRLLDDAAGRSEHHLSKLSCVIIETVYTPSLNVTTPLRFRMLNNLRVLVLNSLNIYDRRIVKNPGVLPDMVHNFATTLSSFPNLVYLELSAQDPGPMGTVWDMIYFFDYLCSAYRMCGYKPMRLKSLILGPGMFLVHEERTLLKAIYLQFLTHTEDLEELHLYGGASMMRRWFRQAQPILWRTLYLDDFPSLRRLHIRGLDESGLKWFSESGASLLSNLYLHVEDEEVEPIFHFMPIMPSDDMPGLSPKLPVMPRGLGLRLILAPRFSRNAAPDCWANIQTLFLAVPLDVFQESPRSFPDIARAFFLPMSSLQVLSLSLDLFDDQWGEPGPYSPDDGELTNTVLQIARTCPSLRVIRLGFPTYGPDGFPDFGEEQHSWRVVREYRAPLHKGQYGPELPAVRVIKLGQKDAEVAFPVELWSRPRKMMQFVR